MRKTTLDIYAGAGVKRPEACSGLPQTVLTDNLSDSRDYVASSGLRDAVNVALALGQPLLVTGEPGTGKTELAASIAWELDLPLLTFHTKTTSTADDLFYHYDALRRFQDIQLKMNHARDIETYITCQALGVAILLSAPSERGKYLLPEEYRNRPQTRSVVLIDEIDKAPRDLPNDLLHEVEKLRFRIRETTWPAFAAKPAFRPIVVLTSNSEKNLPDAFLRRCVFFHIDFPEPQGLRDIISRRFNGNGDKAPVFPKDFINGAVDHFLEIRELGLRKKPATAELLAWISILDAMNVNPAALKDGDRKKLAMSYSVLAKNREDLNQIRAFGEAW